MDIEHAGSLVRLARQLVEQKQKLIEMLEQSTGLGDNTTWCWSSVLHLAGVLGSSLCVLGNSG